MRNRALEGECSHADSLAAERKHPAAAKAAIAFPAITAGLKAVPFDSQRSAFSKSGCRLDS
jgi:O-acetyl-ADP-ribose deacetylase (regulator of RNase III)